MNTAAADKTLALKFLVLFLSDFHVFKVIFSMLITEQMYYTLSTSNAIVYDYNVVMNK